MGLRRTNGNIRLVVEQLESREVPADRHWLGTIDSDWHRAGNWLGDLAPGANDVAVLSGTPTNAPEIPFDTSATVANVILHQTATFDLTIYGTLVTKGSLIQPTRLRGFKGSGKLTLMDTAGVEYDHVWTRGFNKVKTVGVEGGKLEVASTFGQLGPDAVVMGGSSDWKVGTSDSAGAVELNGDHFVGFDWLIIVKGEVKYVTGGTLTDLPIPGSLTPWKAFGIENVDKFEIAEG